MKTKRVTVELDHEEIRAIGIAIFFACQFWIDNEYLGKEDGREQFYGDRKEHLKLLKKMLGLIGDQTLHDLIIAALEFIFAEQEDEDDINFGFSKGNNNNQE